MVEAKTLYEKLPEVYKEKVNEEAKYAAIENHERIVIHGMIATATAVLLAAVFIPFSLPMKLAAAFSGLLTGPPLIPYVIISIAAEKRKNEMERVLSDALLLMSANLKSGLNIEKAFLLSARDEFGPLAEELRQTAMEMFGGEPVEEALMDLEHRVKSELFSETIK
ncbi:MAG: type II secretion system F family protein, partial [Candidatus Nanohaloarchaea archaeon]